MRFLKISITFAFVTLVLMPFTISACSCIAPGPPCQAFWSTPVVFSGRVTEIKTTKIEHGDNAFSYGPRTVKFTVFNGHRGGVNGVTEVRTGAGGGDCGYDFKVDEDYLVYAYKGEDGQLSTGICTLTKSLAKAAEDIAYIDSLSKAKPVGSISGWISQYRPRRADDEYRPPPPLANITVMAEGKSGKFETRTDAEGKYQLADLLPGEYTLRMAVPDGLTGEKESKVIVPEKGCSIRSFHVTRENSISGRVISANGESLKDLLVSLVPVEQIKERHFRDHQFTHLDEDGRFDFRSIPPGNYYLGVRLSTLSSESNKFPRTFYPGTPILEDAIPVMIAEGGLIKDLDFQLPAKLSERKIDGIVTFPDGKPAPGAMVILVEGMEVGGRGFDAGKDGRFSLTLLDGIMYRVKAVVQQPVGQQRHAEFVDIPLKGNVKDIKLVITEANGNCAKCLR
ncbi:MAG TPA: hypothetical protein VNA17_01375 [Pyrinomonadaceae bacterium]|nr:hypothetical protein [Pyrinomonadaceae bacterium]